MKTYTITPVKGLPDWKTIPALCVSEILWLPDAGIRMEQQIAYDAGGLYVRQRAWEKDIRAEGTDPLCSVCQDSCMEFFFSPESGKRYFNLECNLNGCIYFGFGAERESRMRLIMKDPVQTLQLRTARLADGWEVSYYLPLSLLWMFFPEFTLTPGQSFTANCYKCGDMTEKPHYLAWNPVECEKPDYHRPEYFGRMILG